VIFRRALYVSAKVTPKVAGRREVQPMRDRLLMPALALVLLATAACGGGDGEPDATATPEIPGPEVALADWVAANRNVAFIADCDDAQRGADTGKLCATLLGERGTRRAYALGPTFSQATGLAMLEQAADGWTVLSVTNRDPSAGGIPGIPWPLQSGDAVVVIGLGDNDCLRIREQPSQQAAQLLCVPDGTRAIVQEGPVDAETFTWWRIAGEGFNGWAAGTWLRLEDAIREALEPPEASPTTE
jgi:hypothetical protein